jgi:large subunit ribosomal protein L35
MPKMRSHRGLSKRVKRTASGRLKRKRAYRRHILVTKSRKRKRQLAGSAMIAKVEEKRLNAILSM